MTDVSLTGFFSVPDRGMKLLSSSIGTAPTKIASSFFRSYDLLIVITLDEIAVIVQDGIRQMVQEGKNVIYYITVANEPYKMPPMPGAVEPDQIIQGLYKVRPFGEGDGPRVHLFGSGSILREALKAREILTDRYGINADAWSVTSYNQLRREALEVERWNMLHPNDEPRIPYVQQQLADQPFPIVAATDYMKVVPEQIARWMPRGLLALGTDGFGRSDDRQALRRYFEVDAPFIVLAAVYELVRSGDLSKDFLARVISDLKIDPEKQYAAIV
ncbi:MAG: hypothetical protein IID43_04415 [Planctomycetes bacterium]|nr:hypothetical protein [Planctomycetota bacterium]